MLLSADLERKLSFEGEKRVTKNSYTGAGVAFETVVRLIFRACSLTLNFASTIEEVAAGTTVDLHRLMVDFGATGTRILDACNAMTFFLKIVLSRKLT